MEGEAHDSREIANYFIEKSLAENRPLTPMQIVKLVYISIGWYLALYDKLICKHDVEAWPYGPVIVELYHALKSYGKSGVTKIIQGSKREVFTKKERKVLDIIYETYSKVDGWKLSLLTHKKDSPWDRTNIGEIISINHIQEYYQKELDTYTE